MSSHFPSCLLHMSSTICLVFLDLSYCPPTTHRLSFSLLQSPFSLFYQPPALRSATCCLCTTSAIHFAPAQTAPFVMTQTFYFKPLCICFLFIWHPISPSSLRQSFAFRYYATMSNSGSSHCQSYAGIYSTSHLLGSCGALFSISSSFASATC